jgi:hypothetical protein
MNPDSMSEADLTKSFTHDRPEPTTQPPIKRPASMNQDTTAMPMGPICPGCGHPATATWVDDQGDRHYRHEQTTTAPGPDECVVGTDPAVAVFGVNLTSVDLRPAKACSICGQPLPLAVLDFHPAKQDCIRALRARVERLERALNELACWRQGAEVTGDFDDPYSARLAREALA